ncbi:hypothetical protein [Pediococcus claussenii]|nr:hypothetical protein [Pediococcus claussenii]ANZ70277.1 hypothetical protein AYR57_08095 [Pediococcus claussenii]ANZ72093.1 hypothetical protein AYR58_08095 [Pediococcus claussenii]
MSDLNETRESYRNTKKNKKQTRAAFEKNKITEEEQVENNSTNIDDSSRAARAERFQQEQRESIEQAAENKSKALAKKLNIAIVTLVIAIIAVFLILFFVG